MKHGKIAHTLFTILGLIADLIAGAAVSAFIGMSIRASYWILPVVIIAYVVVGGLRSTFVCDFLHSTILYACIFTFMFETYAVNPIIGSPGMLYDMLKSAQRSRP